MSLRRFARGIALGLMLVLLCTLTAQASPESELEQRRQELLRVEQEIEEQKQNILQKRQQEKTVSSELRRLELDLEKTQKELAYVEADISYTQQRAANTAIEIKRAEAQLAERNKILSSRVRALYDVGAVGYLEVLLKASDFSDFLSRFDFLQSLVAQDVTLMEGIKDQKEEKRATVSSRASDREKYLDRLESERLEYEKALDELEKTSEELVGSIQKLQAQYNITPTQTLKFSWPVIGRITSPFGRRVHPITRKLTNHTGIDIGVASGTPVKAAEAGMVITSAYTGGYGRTIIIDHGNGLSTLYAHNSVLKVSVGTRVTKGQVVALAGSTGLSTGPHVHFEVRSKGTPADPMKYLK